MQAKKISLDIFFRSYNNSKHKDKSDECCTHNCARVRVCLQSLDMGGSPCAHGELSFTIDSDDQNFSTDGQIGTGEFMRSISNPISFQVNPVSFKMSARITCACMTSFLIICLQGKFRIYVNVSNVINNSTILTHRRNVDAQASDVGFMSGPIWSKHRIVKYTYQVGCALTYFGPNCSRFCVAVGNSTGHFKCNVNGERECLPGYTNSSESDGHCTECVPGSPNMTCHEPGQYIILST